MILIRSAASTWTGDTYSFFYGGYNTRFFDDQSIYVPEFRSIQEVRLIYFDVLQSVKYNLKFFIKAWNMFASSGDFVLLNGMNRIIN